MNKTFEELKVIAPLIDGLGKAGITTPTAIQLTVIEPAVAGKDIIAQSPTGTGKTLAYVLPLLQKIDTAKRETQAMILAPTHELAIQIHRQIETLAESSGLPVTATPLIGDVNIVRQIDKLKTKPHIVTGSSGRILELIQKKKLNPQTIKTIILDEADRLLDEKNLNNIAALIKTTQKDRQLMAFSATITPASLQKAQEFMKQPLVLSAKMSADTMPDIEHVYFLSDQRDKFDMLRKVVRGVNIDRALVFINKSDDVELTVSKLNYNGLTAAGLHGSFVKHDRKKALEDFRGGRVQLLVASDIAARGLDIPGVGYIFNLDLPEDPEVYLHRAGRTGRAGESGIAISLVSPREVPLIGKYEKVLKLKMQPKVIARGEVYDKRSPAPSMSPAPKGVSPRPKSK